MQLSELRFASYLVYTRRGSSALSVRAKNFIVGQLKQDAVVAFSSGGARVTATSYLVERLERAIAEGALQDFFSGEDTLVPVPGSGVTRPEGLWVPKRLAEGLMSRGLGGRVATLLRRAEPVAKSAFAGPGERPGPREHFESMMVVPPLVPPNRICLVDDVVTKGATLLGAANRLVEAFPDVEIRGFAAVRHVGFREEIDAIEEPCVGTIRLTESGDAEREP